MIADLCLFGGSFNPPHRTHERIARAALAQLPVRRVLVLPAGPHPLKDAGELAPPAVRLELCRLAFAGIAGVEVDDWETSQPGRGYTVDTVAHFRAHATGGKRPFWIVGSDNLAILPTWHRHRELLRSAVLATYPRLGHPVDEALLAAAGLSPPERREVRRWVLDVEPDDVSASDIRRRLAAGQPVAAQLHPAVEARIRALGLWGAAPR